MQYYYDPVGNSSITWQDYPSAAQATLGDGYLQRPPPPPLTTTALQGGYTCSHDKAYVAILITIVPLGVMLTILVILALIAFHKSIRATKIYDNCTSLSANYVYHIEIRTGDTSATYNRRRSTLTIDMFDENQMTLARLAVPGHVIFGRRESPIESVDDDKFGELRVTRLWLYRATRLRRVATIRLTHTCSEPEARIMIYGVELRTDDEDRHRLFFPVMSYITAYGTVNRPNACFDADPIGTISAMGTYPDSATISEHLTYLDYGILVFFFCALIVYLSTLEFFPGAFQENAQAVYKGAVLGCICFAVCFTSGVLLRYVLKHYYSLNVGRGPWAAAYFLFAGTLSLGSFVLWIYTAFVGYKSLCSNLYSAWLLSICVAVLESIGFLVMCATVAWMLVTGTPVYAEQFVMPEDPSATAAAARQQQNEPDFGGGVGARNKTMSRGQQQKSSRPQSPGGASSGQEGPHHSPPHVHQHHGQQQHHHPQSPAAIQPWHTSPSAATPPLLMGVPLTQSQQPQQQFNYQTAYGTGQQQQPPYMQMPTTTTYKVAPFTPPPPGYGETPPPPAGPMGYSGQAQGPGSPYYGQSPSAPPPPQQPAPMALSPPQATTTATPPTVFHTMQLPRPTTVGGGAASKHHHTHQHGAPFQQTTTTYQQQVGAGGKQSANSSRKTGSNESTGSTYYQQLMKNKGGVKSISQYGELLKKNKK